MPELPEVETTRRGIEPLVINKIVDRVNIYNASLRWPVPDELVAVLPGQKVSAIGRRSKYLLFHFDRGTLIVHLGMTGHLRLDASTAERRKHDHVEIVFKDGTALRYNDSRRFGAMLWTVNDPHRHVRLSDLGPEPFNAAFNPAYLYKLSRARRIAVKPFLMDARVVVGVGNIYASEALFRAGIAPGCPAGRVTKAAYARLVAAVREILEAAIAAGGTTIRDFADSQGRPGYFTQELRVYGRAGQACVSCGDFIRQVKLGQRSTYYCPTCQK
ncbi:MAG: bifunctional DNA-formamidopyrimidine glycosylase/DNA-(apurinic or apyrimidinic site) lyase [Desulfuromonadales bacterium]|jgi:formamidopyrimidine-DNA glycosylase|nr:bifunctional DNA-formamidopyrimidine glycosylase/DNA-(apurinic or apyrimidinic site) lyase [Desulfuromonadales bacterium]